MERFGSLNCLRLSGGLLKPSNSPRTLLLFPRVYGCVSTKACACLCECVTKCAHTPLLYGKASLNLARVVDDI